LIDGTDPVPERERVPDRLRDEGLPFANGDRQRDPAREMCRDRGR
jgi:hypothetical protein